MPLVSLTINGFKSFADKIKIEFNPGITGIVGPNGSGKSNVTEAIRWVMGESSAKSLRGDSMQDVIFGGSELRPPLNRAEVTLVFDNQSKQLKTDATSVEVTRRVFRNGDSDFLINKKDVRLKDIHQLFMDAGLSRDSFSIISQGRVEQIFNSRPENRRSIIEEAAGVLHFKQQKQAAQTQLAQTTDNLVRINDLVNELKDRIEPLHEQSSLAREYQQTKAQLDTKLQLLTALEISDLLAEKTGVSEKAAQVNEMVNSLDETVNADQAKLNELRLALQEKNNVKEAKQEELRQVEAKLADLNTKLQVSQQSDAYDSSAEAELRSQIAETEQLITAREASLEQLQQNFAEIKRQKNELERQATELRDSVETDPQSLEDQLERLRSEYIDSLQKQTSVKNQLVYEKAELAKMQVPEKDNVKELDAEYAELADKLAELLKQQETLKTQDNELIETISTKNNQIDQIEAELSQLQSEQANYNQHQQKYLAESESLARIQERHDGYYVGVKNILNHLQDFPGIMGTFGDLINFDFQYQDALTAALGGSVQHLVAQNQLSAKNAIKELKQKNFGRATFLPLDVLRFRLLADSTKKTLAQIEGFIGVGADLVEAPAEIQNAVDYLLGNILVVDNIDTATRVSQTMQQRYRIVTLDGDILSPGGSMTGGTRAKANNSLLENKARKQKLEQQLAQTKEKLQQISSNIELRINNKTRTNAELTDLLQTKESLRDQLKEIQFKLEQVKTETDRAQKMLDLAKKQADNFAQALNEQQSKIKETVAAEQEANVAVEKQKQQIVELQEKIKNFDVQYAKIQEQLNKLTPEIAILATKADNQKTQIHDTTGQISKLKDQLHNTKNRLEDVLSSKEIKKTKHSEYAANHEQELKNQAAIHKNLTEISAESGKLSEQIALLEESASRNYDLRKNAANEQEQNSVQLTKLDNQLDQRLELLREEYSISYEAAIAKVTPEMKADDEREQLEKDVKLHKMSLAEIGNVNLDSIAEYESVKTRFDFLNSQQNDLLDAKNDLEKSMTELDDEVKTRFKKTFEQINAAFSDIFPKMFGGGHAKLVLTEPDDLLITGLEIVAQPPGKKLQQLSLLSGGERALTAITLLFAILKVNPVPFCILDEVEASLDEANVVRFAKFLQNYDLTTQFIVITHRQGTMEQANQLYGVVMQESGVSKVISVSLDEIREEEVG